VREPLLPRGFASGRAACERAEDYLKRELKAVSPCGEAEAVGG